MMIPPGSSTRTRRAGSTVSLTSSTMPTEPVELAAELVARVRDAAGGADPRVYIEAAVRHELDNEAFGKLPDDPDAESGPVPDGLLAHL
jgi:hypothetical protein